eukprot:scaffold17205_cov186-Amphora_coffeaeformis.AAC.13
MMPRWVVVSGSNRGVGLGICRQVLAADPDAHVVVTARQVPQAEDVLNQLEQHYCGSSDNSNEDLSRVHAHALDVTDEASCRALADYVASQDGFQNNDNDHPNPPITLVNNALVPHAVAGPRNGPNRASKFVGRRTIDAGLFAILAEVE